VADAGAADVTVVKAVAEKDIAGWATEQQAKAKAKAAACIGSWRTRARARARVRVRVRARVGTIWPRQGRWPTTEE